MLFPTIALLLRQQRLFFAGSLNSPKSSIRISGWVLTAENGELGLQNAIRGKNIAGRTIKEALVKYQGRQIIIL